MNVKIIATIETDIPVNIPDCINSDTIGEYVTDLNICIENSALDYLISKIPGSILINSAVVDYESNKEYESLINNWKLLYEKEMQRIQSLD